MKVIEQLKQEARNIGGETVIITFHPHPRKIVSSKAVFILNTLEEKIELLESKGIDHLVVVPFDETFAQQTPEEYIEQFLFNKCRPHTVIIGYDHKFGKDRKGDYNLLEKYGAQLGFKVKEIDEYLLHEIIVSSTKIREALLSGDLATANECLGYDYFFEGKVVDGNKLGRTLGYPTANLEIENEEKLIPANGIYAVECSIINRQFAIKHNGMMSIGVRPTIGVSKRTIEVNIFDFDEDIYGEILRVYVKHYLRPEVKFDSLEALTKQIDSDKENALLLLK
jgi:riboflavin kinase/FMN adenylyltransferase